MRNPSRTLKFVRYYVAYGVDGGFRIIDQDDRYATMIDQLNVGEAKSICSQLNRLTDEKAHSHELATLSQMEGAKALQ